MVLMDTTIRNLDRSAYRELKARAALEGKTLGEMVNEAIQTFLARADRLPKRRSLKDLSPEPYGERNKRLSEEIDSTVYGV